MGKREFLQRASSFDPSRHKIAGWFLSEKLEGVRCLWDGGVSRGMPTHRIPWAATIDALTGTRKKGIIKTATGLWSMYGNPIVAPDWFLDKLPPFACDGTLWAGRDKVGLCKSICERETPDTKFDQIQYAVYSAPPISRLFMDGEVRNAFTYIDIDFKRIEKWFKKHIPELTTTSDSATFENELFALRAWSGWGEQVFIHKQVLLPNNNEEAVACICKVTEKLLLDGAAGVIIRDGQSRWTPQYVDSVLEFEKERLDEDA